MWRSSPWSNFAWNLSLAGFALGSLWIPARPLFAVSCAVVHHPAPSEADNAFLAGDYAKAVELYQAALAKNPAEEDLAIGLVRTLLHQHRVQAAESAVHAFIGDKPASAALLTLRAEVELRQGEPWAAAETAGASAKLDPCSPRTMLVFAKLAGLTSRYGTERKMLTAAHQLDPEDPEIWAAWMRGLHVAQRIPQMEAYLAAARGDSAEDQSDMRTELEQLKKWAEEPRKPCTISSQPATAEIPLSEIRSIRGFSSYTAVDVKVNNHRVRLSIDTSYNARLPIEGVSGLLILRPAAEHMGLKPLFENQVPGTGSQGPRSGYVAYADSISVGGVEFRDCAVQVLDGEFWNDADGSFSMSLLSDYLVTLDYPSHKLFLGPLPPRPGSTPANGLEDRYIAPEMKDYTAVYRSGSDLILPGAANGKHPMLFLLDTAVGYSFLSPLAAHEVAEGHRDRKYEVRETDTKVDTAFSAGDVTLSFAHLNQYITHIGSFNTWMFSKDAGMEISGIIGDATLRGLTIRIDYRDGLVKLDFDPKRTGAFSH
jgi:tetratricopeptide (TPR) repeat protein